MVDVLLHIAPRCELVPLCGNFTAVSALDLAPAIPIVVMSHLFKPQRSSLHRCAGPDGVLRATHLENGRFVDCQQLLNILCRSCDVSDVGFRSPGTTGGLLFVGLRIFSSSPGVCGGSAFHIQPACSGVHEGTVFSGGW